MFQKILIITYRPAVKHSTAVIDIHILKSAFRRFFMASVIEKLIFKFNYYVTLLNKLKRAYQKLSEYEKWPIERINFAAGGFL
jgi:hypothetical protein